MPCGETADTFVYASTNIFKRSFITSWNMAYKTQVGNVFVNAVKPDTCSYSSKLVKQQQTQLNTIFIMSLLMSF